MDKRFILFIVLSFAIVMLTNLYVQKFTPQRPPIKVQPTPAATATATATPASTPSLAAATQPTTGTTPAASAAPVVTLADAPRVTLKTKVYEIEFSERGALPVRWDVIDPRFVVPAPGQSKDEKKRKQEQPHEALIAPGVDQLQQGPYPFQTVLQELNSRFYNEFNSGLYKSERISADGQTGYRFTSEPSESGLRMIKTYLFKDKDFTGRLTIELVNGGRSNLTFNGGDTGLGLVLGPGLGKPVTGAMARFATTDPMVKSGDTIEYKTIKKAGESETFTSQSIDWGGIQNIYFMAVLIPNAKNPFTFAKAMLDQRVQGTVSDEKNLVSYPAVELYGKPFSIAPGQRVQFDYEWFFGPKQSQVLKAADHDLNRVLFYNSFWWMRYLCLGLMKLLTWLHTVFVNWGVAIIMLTIIVRLVTFPLVQKGMKAQAKMTAEQARLKPLMDKINEKFKDDPQRKQQEVFKLYKEHGVNPFGMFKGCIWMFIQIPIFFALYKLLYQSIDLRGAHFLWINDLSQPDRLYVLKFSLPVLGNELNLLPFITAATQMLASKFSSTSMPGGDPQQAQMQRTMLYFMPIFILFITYSFPAGLMLYWLISNSWQVLQQMWVNKHMPKPPMGAGTMPVTAKAKA